MTMTTTTTDAKAWIGCLGCYNDGRLVGEWVDALTAGDVTAEDIHGRPTTHAELWVMDHEGLPISGECSPPEAQEWAEVLDSVGECQRDALLAWVRSGDYVAEGCGDLPSVADFEEQYAGEWDSFEEYAAEMFSDLGYEAEMPEHLRPYFDMAAWIRDLAFDYWTAEAPGYGVHVFRTL